MLDCYQYMKKTFFVMRHCYVPYSVIYDKLYITQVGEGKPIKKDDIDIQKHSKKKTLTKTIKGY